MTKNERSESYVENMRKYEKFKVLVEVLERLRNLELLTHLN